MSLQKHLTALNLISDVPSHFTSYMYMKHLSKISEPYSLIKFHSWLGVNRSMWVCYICSENVSWISSPRIFRRDEISFFLMDPSLGS